MMKPSDAIALMRSRSLIEWAADPIENRAWSHARATTKDAHGHVVADHLSSTGDAAHWAAELERLVRLDIGKLRSVLAGEPTKRAPMPREGRSPRPIGVPTFLRRLLSIHIGNVLTITSEPVLPPSVVAYRRGHEDAVVESLMTVSMSVMVANGSVPGGVKKPPQMGVKFWAKLDFQNFFGSLPREAIKAALDHYGYADEFIEIVMAMVEAPVVLRRWAKNHDITKKKGTEQGVAESPVLANLVPFELDEWFQKRAKRILYRRYADDIFIGAATRDEVVGAVRQVQRCPPFSSHPGHFDDREVGKFRLRPGDLLACEGRHIGRCALWNGELDECYYQKALHRLRSKDGRVTSAYMQHFMMLRFRFMTDLVAEANTTSTIPHLPREKLLILPVWYPPREEQDEIVEALGAEAGREQSEVLYLAELQGVKAALMSVLLTGEVRVKPGEDAA